MKLSLFYIVSYIFMIIFLIFTCCQQTAPNYDLIPVDAVLYVFDTLTETGRIPEKILLDIDRDADLDWTMQKAVEERSQIMARKEQQQQNKVERFTKRPAARLLLFPPRLKKSLQNASLQPR